MATVLVSTKQCNFCDVAGSRDPYLDFAKGSLVVFMVIHHTLNYLGVSGAQHLRFVTGSFIFISGYIVSTHYVRNYRVEKRRACKRLLIRGFKLLALFTALNLLISMLGLTNYKNVHFNLQSILQNASAIYFSGNTRFSAFQILVPISYSLLVAPLYIVFSHARKVLIAAPFFLAFMYMHLNMDSYNLSLLLVGLSGMSIGIMADYLRLYPIRSPRVIAFCFLAICSVMQYLTINILIYSAAVIIVTKLVYDFGRTIDIKNRVARAIIVFGKYSLLCYIMQLVFLHGMAKFVLRAGWGPEYSVLAAFLVTSCFLLALCGVLVILRERYKLVDKSYKLIFS